MNSKLWVAHLQCDSGCSFIYVELFICRCTKQYLCVFHGLPACECKETYNWELKVESS